MIDKLAPGEARELSMAKRSGEQCCAHCRFMAILTGPSSAPYAPDSEAFVASIFCRANPPIAVPSRQAVLGVFPPVRASGWCGRFEIWTTKSLAGSL